MLTGIHNRRLSKQMPVLLADYSKPILWAREQETTHPELNDLPWRDSATIAKDILEGRQKWIDDCNKADSQPIK